MGGGSVAGEDNLRHPGIYRLAFEEVVDLFVIHAIGVLVGAEWRKILEIGSGYLVDQVVGCTKMRSESANTSLREPGKWQEVSCPVAKFGEKAHDRLGGVIGADDEPLGAAGESVLRDHTLSGFHVSTQEIGLGSAGWREACPAQGVPHPVCSRSDVDFENEIRIYGGERGVGV